MLPNILLKEIKIIKYKHKKGGYVTIIYFDDFPEIDSYRINHIPTYIIQLKKRKQWRDQKKKYRSNNKEESRRKAREYYHKNKDKLLPQIYAARKRRLDK